MKNNLDLVKVCPILHKRSFPTGVYGITVERLMSIKKTDERLD